MIVPGSLIGENHPFSWYAVVEEKTTGKRYTYWINGNHLNREAVSEWIATYCRGVKAITIDQCTEMPTRPLMPVPPQHFEFGYRAAIEKFSAPLERPGPKPVALRPIAFRPLVR